MKKNILSLTIIPLLIICCLANSFAQTPQELLLAYCYEEGSGSLLIDSSGNGQDAIATGMVWSSNSAFGNYAGLFDGISDYAETNLQNIPYMFSLSTWVYPTSATGTRTLFDMENGTSSYQLDLDYTTTSIIFRYKDDSSIDRTLTLGSTDLFPASQYHFLTFYVDTVAETYSFYRDTVLITSGNFTYGMNAFSGEETLRIGSDLSTSTEYHGLLDCTKLYNFEPSSEQLSTLVSTNILNLEPTTVVNETILTGTQQVSLITSVYPYTNTIMESSDSILINLETSATCEFYLDGYLYRSASDLTSYNFGQDIDVGNHTGRYYCYYDYEGIRYYELVPLFDFQMTGTPAQISFVVSGTDFDVEDYSLYIVTPCIKNIVQVGKFTEDMISDLNKGGTYYFQKLVNGYASFEISEGNHNFCLINGQVQYSEDDFTQDFNINSIDGVLELGDFDVDSNITSSYSIKTEVFEIYEITDPNAWGQTWAGLIGGIILLILGCLIAYAGVESGNGKIVVGGVILILSALGVSVVGFLGVLL